MQIQLRYFASVREAVGHADETWQTQAPTIAALRDELIARGAPHAQALARALPLRTALNHTMQDESAALVDDAEVAFFPPVTGG
jgi:sulfur-carrier protein